MDLVGSWGFFGTLGASASFEASLSCEKLREIVESLQLFVESPNLGVKVWSTPSSRLHSGKGYSLAGVAHRE